MRTVHVGARYRTETTNGVNRAVSLYAKYQRQLGHDVTMVRFSTDEPNEQVYEAETGIRLVCLSAPRSPFRLGPVAADFFRANHLGADVYHFHSAFVPRHNRAAALLSVPYIVSPHSAYLPRGLKRSSLKKRLYRMLLDRRYLKEAAGVHALTEMELEAISQYAQPKRVIMIPNPIEPTSLPTMEERSKARAQFGLSDSDTCLLFVGRFDVEHKGIDLLVDGFRAARRASPTARLRLILAGNTFGSIHISSLMTADVKDFISIYPPDFDKEGRALSASEKRALFAAADIFAYTSRWGTMAVALLEALSHGLPVLITESAGFTDFVQRNNAGQVVLPQANSIAAGTTHMIRTGTSGHEMQRGQIASAVQNEFSPESVAASQLQLYEAAIRIFANHDPNEVLDGNRCDTEKSGE